MNLIVSFLFLLIGCAFGFLYFKNRNLDARVKKLEPHQDPQNETLPAWTGERDGKDG